MPGKIASEIKQSKPVTDIREEAFLNVVRTSGELMRHLDALLKEHGITATQYNVLRILRGAGAKGATCGDVAGRLINAEPDVTRLLDRMEKHGFVRRARGERDRRHVHVYITPAGLALLATLDEPIKQYHRSEFAPLNKAEIAQLIALLEKVRG